jgi:RNA polymerase sigma-70 factor (ECF subfamily)
MDEARRAIETVARHSYGRLVSYLSARWRDVAAVEDALSEAFLAAMRTWPAEGVPDKPEAWLLTAARHRLIDHARHDRMRSESGPALRIALEEAEEMSLASVFPDERLKLLFVCAHPAIDPGVHAPLMLQVVFGLDAGAIARAFLVSPATLSQRLVRAKAKIRDAGIAFDVPVGSELPKRLDAVLDAIYAAYGSGWDDLDGVDPRLRGLTDAALMLARVLIDLLPDEPEARGLLALMLYCESRRQARRADDGAYVPLSEQNTGLWSSPLIEEAERVLASAAALNRFGRFQLEAAIQSAHVERARGGRVDWPGIALLYEGLVRAAPALGAFVGRAAALGEVRGAEAGLALLDEIPTDSVKAYQPYWAVRAHLLQRLGRTAEASEAYDLAIGLTEDGAIRKFLLQRRGLKLQVRH